MRAWWHQLAPRERRTLVGGGCALAVILYYFMLWQPLSEGLVAKREELAQLREDQAWMRKAVERYERRSSRKQSPQSNGDRAVYAIADQSARAAGLGEAMRDVNPVDDGKVRIRVEDAIFEKLLRWLAELKQQHGIVVDAVSLQQASTRGRVSGQLTLIRERS